MRVIKRLARWILKKEINDLRFNCYMSGKIVGEAEARNKGCCLSRYAVFEEVKEILTKANPPPNT